MANADDLDRLIKLMKMTTVSEDNVCLVAIRKANDELKKLGADWESLLKGKIKIVEDPFKNKMPEYRPTGSGWGRPRAPTPPPPPEPPPSPRPQPNYYQPKPKPQPQPTAASQPRKQPPGWTGTTGPMKGDYRYHNGRQQFFDGRIWNDVVTPTNKVHAPDPGVVWVGGKKRPKIKLDDALKDLKI